MKPTTRDYLSVSLFGLATAFLWGAMLTVVMQSLVQNFVGVALAGASRDAIEAQTVRNLGWVLGGGALVAAVTQIVAGALSDASRSARGRRKPFVVFGTLIASLGIAALPFTHSFWTVFAAFLWIQLFLNIATGPFQALLPDTIPADHHGAASAWIGICRLVGSTGGIVAAGLLMRETWGLTALTVIFLVLLNGLMLVTVVLAKEESATHSTASRDAMAQMKPSALLRIVRDEPPFAWLIASRFLIMCGIYTVQPSLKYYLQNVFSLTESVALTHMAFLGLTVNLTGALGTVPAGRAGDRMPKKRVVAVACAICMLGGLGFAASQDVRFALVAAGVFGFGYGAFQAIDWAFACNVIPQGKAGQSAGIWSLADTVPQFIAPVVGGAFASAAIARLGAANGYRCVMLLAVLWFLIGAVLVFKVKEKPLAHKEAA